MAWSLHAGGVSFLSTTTLDSLTIALPTRDVADDKIYAIVTVCQDNSSIGPAALRTVTVTLDPGGAQEQAGTAFSDGVRTAVHQDADQFGGMGAYWLDVTDVTGTPNVVVDFSATPAGGTDWYSATVDLLYGASDLSVAGNIVLVRNHEEVALEGDIDLTETTTGTNQFVYVTGGTITGGRNPVWTLTDFTERHDNTSPPAGGRAYAGTYESTAIETFDGDALGDSSTSGSRFVSLLILENADDGAAPPAADPPPAGGGSGGSGGTGGTGGTPGQVNGRPSTRVGNARGLGGGVGNFGGMGKPPGLIEKGSVVSQSSAGLEKKKKPGEISPGVTWQRVKR